MTVRTMTLPELETVLGWAAAEGWNPGLDDAAAFHAADPQGFFLKLVDDRPAAAVSVVNHDAKNAFLGLYICAPEYRGQGHGLEVWTEALKHAGTRCVGLEGVPAQQPNYARSGFVGAGRTVRWRGHIAPGTLAPPRPDLSTLAQADARATGLTRTAFTTAWFTDTDTRQTLALPASEGPPAFATFRKCREGVKIGPFQATTQVQAMALLALCPRGFGDGPLYIDVPDGASALSDLLSANGFAPVFETARMYRGTPPVANPPPFNAVATLELG